MESADLKERVFGLLDQFNTSVHGNTELWKDRIFVMNEEQTQFAPLSFVSKKLEGAGALDLKRQGFVYSSLDYLDNRNFEGWFKHQFARTLGPRVRRQIGILHFPEHKQIFEAIETIDSGYQVLRDRFVLINGKNLPIQLGEWFAKSIFGLNQVKSSSQRGFDFVFENGERVEVCVHWNDASSPKGVKVKRSLITLSEYCIVVYVARNFTIRDVLILDSNFIERKFVGKGMSVFLKDSDVGGYFFSRSNKHFDKIVNYSALMKFSSPTFAIKLNDLWEQYKIAGASKER